MIWCVEDDSGIRDIELYALQSTGFEARGFEDGLSCWEALKTDRPDLILLDVMLPGMDGVELLRKLKKERKKTFLVILHDLNLAVRYADDLIVLDGGKIRFAGTKEDCLEQGVLEENFSLRRFTLRDGAEERMFFTAE